MKKRCAVSGSHGFFKLCASSSGSRHTLTARFGGTYRAGIFVPSPGDCHTLLND